MTTRTALACVLYARSMTTSDLSARRARLPAPRMGKDSEETLCPRA